MARQSSGGRSSSSGRSSASRSSGSSRGSSGRSAASKKSGGMTVAEAGRLGGQRTAETHGREFYEEIGRQGGLKVQEKVRQYEKMKSGGGRGRSGRSR